jgi:hypothetical protein
MTREEIDETIKRMKRPGISVHVEGCSNSVDHLEEAIEGFWINGKWQLNLPCVSYKSLNGNKVTVCFGYRGSLASGGQNVLEIEKGENL